MIEREKQRSDQQKKHANEKNRRKPSKHDEQGQSEPQAGMATDPQTMKDEGYVERIEEKTKKH